MPTDHILIGGAPAVAQVDLVTLPLDVETAQVITASIGNKTITYTFPDGPLLLSVAAAFVDLWNASEIPEFQEVTAADNGDGSFTLTADTPGQPFTVVFLIGSDTNEIQIITMVNTATGGTFTLTFDGETTAARAYNASAATVATELKALSNIGASDVSVTGSDGGPYTVEFIGTLADTDVAKITADTTLVEGVNEIQTVTLNTATGGTFTLTFEGEETSALAYNASAATVETALEALSTIGVGNVDVTGSAGGPYAVEFIGTLAKADQAALVFDGALLTGGLAASVAETTAGGGGANDRFLIQAHVADWGSDQNGVVSISGDASVTAGTWDLTVKIYVNEGVTNTLATLTGLAWDITVAELQDEIDTALALYGYTYSYKIFLARYGGSTHAGNAKFSDGGSYYFQFNSALSSSGSSSQEGAILEIDNTSLTGGTYSSAATNDIYAGDISDYGTAAGSWRFILDGEETDDLSPTISATDLQAAIEGLTAVGSGNVDVFEMGGTGGFEYGGGFVIEFIGSLANNANGFTITTSVSAGNDLNLEVWECFTGGTGTSEVQTLTITGSPGAGTFGLSYEGEETAALAYNASAATVQTALEALSTIGAGNVVCTGGDLPGTAVVMTFENALGGTDLDMVAVIGGTTAETQAATDTPYIEITTTAAPVTHTTTTANAGPNDWNTAANWDTNTVPVNGDNVFILDGESLLYGPASLVTLGRLEIHNYDVELGLPRRNANYYEYRTTHLKITGAEIVIGLGDAGTGSNQIKLDIENTSPLIEVHDSGTGQDGAAAIEIIGLNAANTAEILILEGEVSLAAYPKEAAYFNKVTQRGGELRLGSDVTIKELIKTGGDIISDRTTVDGLATL